MNILKGIIPATASPCDDNDKFLPDKYAELMTGLYDQGVDGHYVCGATGEGFKMHLPERILAAKIAAEVSGPRKGTVIVHVGTLNTRDSVTLAEHAAKIGAHAVSSIPPAFCSHAQLISFYSDIGKACGLPVIIYHIPMLTGRNPSLQEMLELLDIPGVVGLKFTDWNLYFMKQLIMARPNIVVFNGFDEFLCPGLLYGASGGIGSWYNLFPKVFMGIYQAVQRQDIVLAMDLQNRLCSFCDLGWRNGAMGVFELLMQERGYPQVFRRPRPSLDAQTIKKLRPELQKRIAAIEEVLQPAAVSDADQGKS